MQLKEMINSVEENKYLLEYNEKYQKAVNQINDKINTIIYDERCIYINTKKAYIDDLVIHHFERISEYITEDNYYAKYIKSKLYFKNDSEKINNKYILKFYELILLHTLIKSFEFEISKYDYYNSDVEVIKNALDDVIIQMKNAIVDANISLEPNIVMVKDLVNI